MRIPRQIETPGLRTSICSQTSTIWPAPKKALPGKPKVAPVAPYQAEPTAVAPQADADRLRAERWFAATPPDTEKRGCPRGPRCP